MSKVRTSEGGRGEARKRRQVAQKYLEAAERTDDEEGLAAKNVVVGNCVLAGIAAGDAICLSATGARYAGTDHAEAAQLLRRVDPALGDELSKLMRLKPAAHYGSQFVSGGDRTRALRAARKLVDAAELRTLGTS